jgi:hypothetical protein
MPADLHLHTHYSDGTFTPQELVQRAAHSGLTTISLTDHDTAEGCTETAAACAQAQIEFIHGTELTTELAGTEFHLLGYGFNPHNPSLNQAFHAFQQGRQDRIREMAERLQQHQIPLSAEEIFALANCRSPGRPHVARALVQKGICSSVTAPPGLQKPESPSPTPSSCSTRQAASLSSPTPASIKPTPTSKPSSKPASMASNASIPNTRRPPPVATSSSPKPTSSSSPADPIATAWPKATPSSAP